MSVYYKGTKFTAQGVDDYEQLQNKPSINGIPLSGNVSVGAIQEVSSLPYLPDGKTIYKVDGKLRWWNGTKWASVSAITDWADTESLPQNPDSLTIYKFGDGLGWWNGSEWRPIDKEQVAMKLNGHHNVVTDENVDIYAPTSAGTSGQILKSNGMYNAPTWINAPSGEVTFNGSETTVDTDLGFYAPTSAGTSGQVLTSTGSGAPEWKAAAGGQSCWYGTCDTAANTAAKVVACTGFTLQTGSMITVKFAASNTVKDPTMNVNSTGAKTIRINDANLTASRNWGDGCAVTFVYDGTYWVLINMAEPIDWYAVCSTAASTAAKTATIDNFKLYIGAKVKITFSYNHNSTSAATLNINSTGAKYILYRGGYIYAQNTWMANDLLELVYDGSYWRVQGMMNDPTPVGTMIASFSASTPAGYLFCNGGAVSRTTYSNLYNAISTSFGSGDGSSTFNLPNMNGVFLMGATSGIRGYVGAGLPNISGTIGHVAVSSTSASGAFTAGSSRVAAHWQQNGSQGHYDFTFSAQKSNSIYGNSSTVQPPSYKCYYYIKY